jgi:subtilisin family serine protease
MRLIAAITLTFFAFHPGIAARAQDAHVEGQVLLRLDPSIPDADQKAIMESMGLPIRLHYPLLRMYWLEGIEANDIEAFCRGLEEDARVAWARPNYYGRRTGGNPIIPSDPSFGSQWGLRNTGQVVQGQAGTPDADIDASEAWCVRTDASSVVIAIVDSGCLMTHPDLAANIWQNPLDPVNGVDDDGNGLIDDVNGWDYLGNDNSPTDLDGHGTNVTGVACMRGNNGVGGAGVCWQAQAMILKDGDAFPQAALSALGFQYAAAHTVAVVNFSTEYPSAAQAILTPAIDACRAAGVIVVTSAGNGASNIEGGSLNVPAELTQDNLLVVGASTSQDARASFSNWGPVSVDIFAPGADIFTTRNNGAYTFVSGTSFAAPLAAGSVALVRAQNPTLTHQQVINLFLVNGDVVPAWAGLTVSGMRINLDATLRATPPVPPEYQVNGPRATLNVNSVTGTTSVPALVQIAVGVPTPLSFLSNQTGQPWDLGFGANPLIPRSAGAFATSQGEVVNLDLTDPLFGTWFDYLSTSPPFANQVFSVTFPVPTTFSAQLILLAPFQPSGVALSQPVRVVVQ